MRVHGIILCLACVCEIVLAVPFAGFDVDIEGLSFKPIDSRDGKKQHVVQPLKSHEKSSKRSIKTKGAKKPSHPSSVKKADPKPITVIKSSVKSTTKTTKTVQKGSPMKTTRTSTFTLNLATKTLAPDGVPKVMMVANNQLDYPISVTTGDIVVVVVKNNMKAPTSIHWHGLFQVASPWMDGAGMVTQCLIQPKTSMTYKFSTENQTGTFWWHAHYSSQYGRLRFLLHAHYPLLIWKPLPVDGLRGPFIIHDPADPYKSLYDEEIIVTLSDHFHMPAMNVAKTYYCMSSKPPFPIVYASRDQTFAKQQSRMTLFRTRVLSTDAGDTIAVVCFRPKSAHPMHRLQSL
ncbi:multicopper oxidase-domain-containing protein, partial [Chytriomyces sp. MP71]